MPGLAWALWFAGIACFVGAGIAGDVWVRFGLAVTGYLLVAVAVALLLGRMVRLRERHRR